MHRASAIIDCLPPRRGAKGPVWSARLVVLVILVCALAVLLEWLLRS